MQIMVEWNINDVRHLAMSRKSYEIPLTALADKLTSSILKPVL